MRIQSGEWIVQSLAKGGFEIFQEAVHQSGKSAGTTYKKSRKEVMQLSAALEFLMHQRIHGAQIETWEQLRREIDAFRSELTVLTEIRMKIE